MKGFVRVGLLVLGMAGFASAQPNYSGPDVWGTETYYRNLVQTLILRRERGTTVYETDVQPSFFPPTPQSDFRTGCNALARNDLELARLAFLRAVKLGHPNIRHCYYRLAYVAHLQGDEAAAQEYFQKAFDLEPNDSVEEQGDGSDLLVPYPKRNTPGNR